MLGTIHNDQATRPFAKRPNHALIDQLVRVVTRSCYKVSMAVSRVVVHISRSEHRVLDPEDVYYLRARGGETEVRLSSEIKKVKKVSPGRDVAQIWRIC